MHITDIQYLRVVIFHKNTLPMHDLKDNFDKTHTIINISLADQLNDDGNLQYYPNPPKLSDRQTIALALCQEAQSIDSENWFWSKLQNDYNHEFPELSHLTRYNARRKRLAAWIESLAQCWARAIRPAEDTYMVDSIPVPVASIARQHSTSVCREHFQTAPDIDFSAVLDQYYIGYKLHLVVSLDGGYHSMDLTKASIQDARYLADIKHSGLSHCLLLADKGYLSATRQIDLFEQARIELQTPMRVNQIGYSPWTTTFKKARRRVETVFSQLCDQMMFKRNYAKTLTGLSSRIVCKVAAFTMLQYINHRLGRSINQIKHTLAA